MTEDQFRASMCEHMQAQTKFLGEISEGMHAVRIFGRIIKWISGVASTIAGMVGLWHFLSSK